ncbi:g-protein coupled receptor 157 [Anaeramoeba ignava]|uniref:G-protein coupled receptor 157 n=1 Tax=Anaeramoeba ignava TaxID=1746090 RepID=A0A9Q0LY92_ANAIG|nr:g-protein coupled receptor 157 [Anaeramoeba ignava]
MKKGEEIATIIGSSLGLIGALLIIIIFLYFKENKIFYRKLVFILSIYDLFQSLSYLLPGNSNENLCKIQYYFLAIFASTSQFWSASISLTSYLKIAKEFDDKKLNKIQKWLHLIMFIPIIVLVIIVGYSHDYNKFKNLLILYSFNWTYIIICLIFYILTMIRLRKIIKFLSKEFSSTVKKSQMNQVWIQIRMSLIPLIQIILLIPATIRRLRNMINSSVPDITAVDILHSLLATSQGFWDFWIFIIFDSEMRNKLKHCSSRKNFNNFQDLDSINYELIEKRDGNEISNYD